MFCYQCEQTSRAVACRDLSVCGKDEPSAALQDLIVHLVKGIAQYAHRARQLGASDRAIDRYIIEALFSTVTNVNFDPARLQQVLAKGVKCRTQARQLYGAACQQQGQQPEALNSTATWMPASNLPAIMAQAAEVSIPSRQQALGPDLAGLQELLLYGIKGAAAYADHALILGREDDSVYAFFTEAMDYLARPNPTVPELFALCMKCGEVNLKVMELLDAAHTGTYGHPTPTPVRVTPRRGKAIVVSGHDLKDLEELLKQTEGKGINVYTHGEMLPAHGYPQLKRYPHLVGNYGGAWQDQADEFAAFPGAILMTTNCLQKPLSSYQHRIFTCGLVAWPGVTHVANRDFAPVIAAALAEPGFPADEPEKTILTGFGHNAVMQVAGKVIEGVKAGAIKRFFLIGGCDGARTSRNYYTEFAEKVPADSVILTLACGKYRFNKMDFGAIDGIPRLLDLGQCNDAYSAIQIAVALAKAFNCGVNDLPLSLVLSWYEQKAVAILLTLLYLGIRNIRIGPTLPAFVTPAVLQVLVEKFNLMPITTADEDLNAILTAA
jgi:hydroxylamine reductase